MAFKKFNEYVTKRKGQSRFVEGDGDEKATGRDKLDNATSLKPGQEFHVSSRPNGPHANLAPVIDAFKKSNEVHIGDFLPGGYSTMGAKGQEEPKLKAKKLYLVGGAVRDHIMGKSPKDLDLATEATPSEIRMILLNAGFKESESQGGKHRDGAARAGEQGTEKKQGGHHPSKNQYPPGVEPNPNHTFYSKGWDREGNEFVIGVKVNGEEFELATFRKDSKSGDGRTPDRMEFAGLDDDAARRDLTMNSMYLQLDNSDGPNKRIVDPTGGAAHLDAGEVRFVGKAKDRLEEDQLRALRYARFLARFGDHNKIPAEYESAIRELADQKFPAVSRERIRDEFLKGLEHKDVDPKKLITIYKRLGMLDSVFPGMKFKLDAPEDFSDEKERHLAIAWMLRENDPQEVAAMLKDGKWSNGEVAKVAQLLKVMKLRPDIEAEELEQIFKGHMRAGLFGKTLDKWGGMTGIPTDALKAFHDFAGGDRVRPMVQGDDGENTPHDDFVDLFDPFTGQPASDDMGQSLAPQIRIRIRDKEHGNFQKLLQQHAKLNTGVKDDDEGQGSI